MYLEYDLFEKFPDGSSLRRSCVSELIQFLELTKKSAQFHAIDKISGKIVHSD